MSSSIVTKRGSKSYQVAAFQVCLRAEKKTELCLVSSDLMSSLMLLSHFTRGENFACINDTVVGPYYYFFSEER